MMKSTILRPGILHDLVTPWEFTGNIRMAPGRFGGLVILVEQHRLVCGRIFNWLYNPTVPKLQLWEVKYRWRRPRYADLQAIEKAITDRRKAFFGVDTGSPAGDAMGFWFRDDPPKSFDQNIASWGHPHVR